MTPTPPRKPSCTFPNKCTWAGTEFLHQPQEKRAAERSEATLEWLIQNCLCSRQTEVFNFPGYFRQEFQHPWHLLHLKSEPRAHLLSQLPVLGLGQEPTKLEREEEEKVTECLWDLCRGPSQLSEMSKWFLKKQVPFPSNYSFMILNHREVAHPCLQQFLEMSPLPVLSWISSI